ncbi:MAG: chemoreceptor glutamine deamidase CheD [Gammaproteobacteria bacterium]
MALAQTTIKTSQFQHELQRSLKGFSHISRYWDKYHSMYAAKILPGQFYVTKYNEIIVTVLGSCISACIRDPIVKVGGMNHFMLPTNLAFENSSITASDSARYGNFAMELLINEILKHGGKKENLEVKIFGGGKIIRNMTDVGQRNIAFIKDYLATERLDVIASDVGSPYPRKVYYFPETGKVRVKRLRSLHNNTIIDREFEYLGDIARKPVSGEIDLFD